MHLIIVRYMFNSAMCTNMVHHAGMLRMLRMHALSYLRNDSSNVGSYSEFHLSLVRNAKLMIFQWFIIRLN